MKLTFNTNYNKTVLTYIIFINFLSYIIATRKSDQFPLNQCSDAYKIHSYSFVWMYWKFIVMQSFKLHHQNLTVNEKNFIY